MIYLLQVKSVTEIVMIVLRKCLEFIVIVVIVLVFVESKDDFLARKYFTWNSDIRGYWRVQWKELNFILMKV